MIGYVASVCLQIAVEALQDKIDESEDKEQILGNDILNPTTGVKQGLSHLFVRVTCCTA